MFSQMKEDHYEWLQIHYFTPTAFEKANAIWPIRLGSTIAKPHYHIKPRIAPYYYLLCVVDGEGSFIQNGQQYQLKKNDIYCLLPQVAHEYFTSAQLPLHLVYIAFDGTYAPAMLEKIGLTSATPHVNNRVTPEVLAQFQQLFDEHASDLKRTALMYQLFDQLAINNRVNEQQLPLSPQLWLRDGKRFLETHYADLISIESVAKHVGIERTHFSKRFQSAYRISPIAYLQQIRMQKAMLLLKQTNYKMSEIAHSVGYSDLPTFSKAFKKWNGLSPIQYRHQHKQEQA